jgi:hypothetical protein
MRLFKGILMVAALATAQADIKPALAERAASKAPYGEPANRWRYQYYSGRWWYWKPGAQWSYYDGRRWVDWGREPSPGRQVAGVNEWPGQRSTLGYRALGVYPFNYGNPPTDNSGAVPPNPTGARIGVAGSGFGAGTIAGGNVGVGLETGSRSGDISSGVGGGSVGGADVSGWNQRK